ncbi:MAG: CHAD domain-containing protein [Solirubrobacteraceae bacterium]
MSGATLGEVVTTAIGRSAERLLRNDPIMREGDASAVEAVHQMRVATRRLRSDLRTFRSALDRRWRRGLHEELAWIAQPLGAARDTDVLAGRLSAHTRELAPGQARAAIQAVAALERAAAARARPRWREAWEQVLEEAPTSN